MMLNDSNDISCTVPVFAGNEAAPFPGIQERKMTGIPGPPGNGRPGMKTLIRLIYELETWFNKYLIYICYFYDTFVFCLVFFIMS